mmetsp:Transcript_47954/g.89409  ORF Transcript_47954/g.89409 Transcript_47954/m.89409 type:complete len:513 (+) Transcript_47954:277-1815(+)
MVDVVVTTNRAGEKVCKVSDEVELHSAIAMSSCTIIEFEDDISLDATTTPMITSKMGLTIDGHGHTLSGANAKQCLYITNSDVVIKHLTFFQCNPDSDGGAIFSKNSVLSLSHCSFNENGLKGLHFGGAIRADDTDIDLEKCSFKGNKARDGGALRMFRGTLSAVECTFERNEAESSGGVIYASASSFFAAEVYLRKCSFKRNKAFTGGALSIFRGKLSAVECTFELNESESGGYGGAIRASAADVDLDKCSFKENSSKAIYAFDTNVDLKMSSFNKNKAVVGGALQFVVQNGNSYQLIISDSVFENNEAEIFAGGITVENIGLAVLLTVTLNRVKIAGNKQEGRLNTEAGAGLNFNLYGLGNINVNLIGCSFAGNLDSAQAPSDLWYASETTTVNIYSTCAEGFFAEGKGVLACYESDGTSVKPCDPAIPADLSGKCEKCGKGSFSCCGATECTDSEPTCKEYIQELTCPSPKGNHGKTYSENKNNKKKKVRGPLRQSEPLRVFSGKTRVS